MDRLANAPRSSLARVIAKRDELVARKRQIESHLNYLERKARTRRLIQQGALAEKYLGVEDIAEMEALLQRIVALSDSDGKPTIGALRDAAIDEAEALKAAQEATEEVLRDARPER